MWPELLTPILLAVATALVAFFGNRIVSPKDYERAAALDMIALGAASLVRSLNPTKPWADLLELVVQQITTAAGRPTTNKDAIQRAAAAALTRIGVEP